MFEWYEFALIKLDAIPLSAAYSYTEEQSIATQTVNFMILCSISRFMSYTKKFKNEKDW